MENWVERVPDKIVAVSACPQGETTSPKRKRRGIHETGASLPQGRDGFGSIRQTMSDVPFYCRTPSPTRFARCFWGGLLKRWAWALTDETIMVMVQSDSEQVFWDFCYSRIGDF